MRSISDFQEVSFGLVIGGKSLTAEQGLIRKMNILICTPGRLLQHLQDTVDFEYSNCKMVVIDEADEIIMMGFLNTITEIINYLPKNCQTMLFSATLSSKVLNLGKVALKVNSY
jgi:ATP-dependent RNA helicase DDX10/DBP4